MKGLFIINPSSGKQNIDSMLREIMATLILDQICSHVDVFYTKGKDDAKNRAAELKPGCGWFLSDDQRLPDKKG